MKFFTELPEYATYNQGVFWFYVLSSVFRTIPIVLLSVIGLLCSVFSFKRWFRFIINIKDIWSFRISVIWAAFELAAFAGVMVCIPVMNDLEYIVG